jgi:hypothetical protein
MPTNYPTFQSQFFNAVAAVSSDVPWGIEFPLVIDRAEQRAYRDLDMLAVRSTVIQTLPVSLQRLQTIQPPTFVAVETVSVITPAGVGSSGFRNLLTRVSPAAIELTYPSDSQFAALPQFYAMISDTGLLMGPPPNLVYSWEVRGPVRPVALSSGNSSTVLTQNYPDLFFASAMVEAGMYMRFVEPQMSVSWLAEYEKLKTSALIEEMRKRNMAEGWVDKQPSPVATPPRQ